MASVRDMNIPLEELLESYGPVEKLTLREQAQLGLWSVNSQLLQANAKKVYSLPLLLQKQDE